MGLYITGKVEKLYKGNIKPEELMCKYPEETEVLYKEKSSLRFKDMRFILKFHPYLEQKEGRRSAREEHLAKKAS